MFRDSIFLAGGLRRCLLALLAAISLGVSATAVAQSDNNNDDGNRASSGKGQIAILVNSLDNPYYAAEANGAKEKAADLGYSPVVLSHNEDVNRQRELISSMVAKGVKGIVLDNANSEASVAAVQYAKDHGVPVVLINREIPKDGVAIAQLSHNNVQAASQVARTFVDKVGEQGKYVELTCSLADNNCVTRSKAFHRVLDQYPDLKMVSRQDTKGVLVNAKESMDSILQENPDIDGVIAGNGPAALGAIASLQNAGKNKVDVVGMDGSNDEIKAINAGRLDATAMLQAQKLARDGVGELDQYLRTGSTGKPERQLYRGILITQDNADKVNNFAYDEGS